MCNRECLAFGANNLTEAEVKGKKVLEVGARDVNGTLRHTTQTLNPASYLAVDLVAGLNVDEICDAEQLVAKYGKGSFDVVLTTEMLEHVKDWQSCITNLKGVTAPGGVLVITTRSLGFPYHEYPGDYWRFEVEDMERIFADWDNVLVQADPSEPGVFVKATKPKKAKPQVDLAQIALYSMQTESR